MIGVLFVCLGNICRSPMAEAIFKHKITSRGLEKYVRTESCGTSNYHIGDDADKRTIAIVRHNAIHIKHCVRQITSEDLDAFDFIVAMDKSNLQNVLRLARSPAQQEKVFLMRDYDPIGKGQEVPDPYYGNEKHFQEVFDILERSTENFVSYLETNVVKHKARIS